jgi:hypothetical protein
VPMIPVAHGGSAVAFKADVTGAHSSPLSNERWLMDLAAVTPRLDAECRADRLTAPTSSTASLGLRADSAARLEVGTGTVPSLATCGPEGPDGVTRTLREACSSTTAAPRRQRRGHVLLRAVGRGQPAPIGRDGSFPTSRPVGLPHAPRPRVSDVPPNSQGVPGTPPFPVD